MDFERLINEIDALNEQYINIWEDVCNIESPTNFKKGVDEVGNYFIRLAKEKGWKIEVLKNQNAGDAICITLNPDVPGAPIVYSGHIDTVHPVGSFGTPAVRRDGTCIYGPGVMDCKGGVVAAFMAMDALERYGFKGRPIKLFIQSDEETSSRNSEKRTIEFMLKCSEGAAAFLNGEGIQGNTAVLARKGILRYRYQISGKAMHSARCAEGANAIAEAASKILELEKMKDPSGLTANCGLIEGGTAPNSVADRCSFTVDIRFADEDQYSEATKRIEEIGKTYYIPGCTATWEKVSERPAMPRKEDNTNLLNKMNEIFAKANLPVLRERSCLSGSDAAYISRAMIPVVDNLGVDGGKIHSVDEFAYLDSLAASAKRFAVLSVL